MALGQSDGARLHDRLTVLGLVGPELRARLVACVEGVRLYRAWSDLAVAVEGARHPVVFIDPGACDDFAERSQALRESRPECVLVLFTSLRPELIKRCLPLVSNGVSDLVFAGFDDTRPRIAGLLADIATRTPHSLLDNQITELLARLPNELRATAELMFRQPTLIRSVGDLALRARMSKRAVFRHLREAGIRSGRLLVAASRVLAAHRLLRESDRSVAEVAGMLGCSSSDQLSERFGELLGRSARQAKVELDCAAAAAMIARVLTGNSCTTDESMTLVSSGS